jgi:hypothetical protein
MPKVAYADIVDELRSLIAAVDQSPDLAATAPQRAALAAKLERIEQLKKTQDAARATKQECTQKLRQEVTEARMLAIQLRGSIRALIDPRSERLTHFKVAPIRKHPRRAAEGVDPAAGVPAEPPAEATD